MDINDVLKSFLDRAVKDPRVGTIHIALYVTIVQIWVEQGRKDRLHLFSYQGMERAKIASRCTYSRVINDLKDFGFLHYEPSLYKQKGSMISIPIKELNKEKDEGYGKERRS